MTGTKFELILFDFDGTLVQSAEIKRRAFFEIFPEACYGVVAAVLREEPDAPRGLVIPKMLSRMKADGLPVGTLSADALIGAYGEQAAAGVMEAEAVPFATEGLKWASRNANTYVFSVTPHEELLRQLARRCWNEVVLGAYGFPNHKPEVLRSLMQRHDCSPDRTLVVGDGSSDADAARANGCLYLRADTGWPGKLMRGLGEVNV